MKMPFAKNKERVRMRRKSFKGDIHYPYVKFTLRAKQKAKKVWLGILKTREVIHNE